MFTGITASRLALFHTENSFPLHACVHFVLADLGSVERCRVLSVSPCRRNALQLRLVNRGKLLLLIHLLSRRIRLPWRCQGGTKKWAGTVKAGYIPPLHVQFATPDSQLEELPIAHEL